MRSLLTLETRVPKEKLRSLLHYDGSPITARFIAGAMAETASSLKIVPLRKAAT